MSDEFGVEFVDLDELERLAGPLLDPRYPPEWFSSGDVMLTDLPPEDEAFVVAAAPGVVLALVRVVRAAVAVREGPGGSVTGNGGRVFALAELGAFNAMCEALAPFRGPPAGA